MSIEHQLKRYIVYTCKKCNWQTSILAQWADLKPKKCPNKKCGCFFLKEPGQLDVKPPKDPDTKPPAPNVVKKKKKRSNATIKKVKENGRTRRTDRHKEEERASEES